jgi:hypothetical protein
MHSHAIQLTRLKQTLIATLAILNVDVDLAPIAAKPWATSVHVTYKGLSLQKRATILRA